MKSTDIPNILLKCKSKKNATTILIDGPWGCGKTYNVKEFLKNSNNDIYISLFGLEKESEIIIRLSEYLDSNCVRIINNEFFLVESDDEVNYGNLIVFDDLERKKKELPFNILAGIINKLNMLGFSVCCIVNSEFINSEEKDDFMKLREKTFCSYHSVIASNEAVKKITNINDDESINKYLLSAKHNLRIIERSYIFIDDLKKELNEKHIDSFFTENSFDENIFFRCTILAYRCYFSFNKEKPSFKYDNTGFKELAYNEDVLILDKYMANELNMIFEQEKENSTLKDLVVTIINAIRNDDKELLINEYHSPIDDSLTNASVFLLSDKEKKTLVSSFSKKLSIIDFSESKYYELLKSILRYAFQYLSKTNEKTLLKVLKNNISISKKLLDERMLFGVSEENEREKLFYEDLIIAINKEKEDAYEKSIENYIKNKDYKKLTDSIYRVNQQYKGFLLEKLMDNDFLIPNLEESISNEAWTYCHEVANFAASTNKVNEFIKVLENQCKKSKSISVREKCNAIVKYRFNMEKDFFKDFPIKK